MGFFDCKRERADYLKLLNLSRNLLAVLEYFWPPSAWLSPGGPLTELFPRCSKHFKTKKPFATQSHSFTLGTIGFLPFSQNNFFFSSFLSPLVRGEKLKLNLSTDETHFSCPHSLLIPAPENVSAPMGKEYGEVEGADSCVAEASSSSSRKPYTAHLAN